ncbi:MAG: hypothetical protein KAQ98_03330 [Bacteriovoracaceae bacterium]|nr:hypothetical protein [Bacteriovoracaceae bacterium]
MQSGIIKFIMSFLLFIWAILPVISFGADNPIDRFDLNGAGNLSLMQKAKIQMIVQRNALRKNSRKCPLKSERYTDILSRMQNIRTLLVNNCLDTDKQQLDAILDGTVEIQERLDALTEATNTVNTAGVTSNASPPLVNSDAPYIAGVQGVFDGLRNVFSSDKCKSVLEDKSFLNYMADIVYGVAQAGLLVPNQNGLILASTGTAVSGFLNFIDKVFTPRFKFEDANDRQVFIKINCAFHDLRQEVNDYGLFNLSTPQNKLDFTKASAIMSSIDENTSRLIKARKKIDGDIRSTISGTKKNNAKIEKERDEYVKIMMKRLKSFESDISGFLELLKVPADVVEATEVLAALDDAYISGVFLKNFGIYKDFGIEKRDRNLIRTKKILGKLSSGNLEDLYDGLSSVSEAHKVAEKIKIEIVLPLRRQLGRMLANMDKKRMAFANSWNTDGIIAVDDAKLKNGVTVKVARDVVLKKIDEMLTDLNKDRITINPSFQRLGIRSKQRNGDYSSLDEGTETLVSINQEYEHISAEIFGIYGYEFVKYASEKSYKVLKKFSKLFKKMEENDYVVVQDDEKHKRSFKGNHIFKTYDENLTSYVLVNPDEIDIETKRRICQDVKYLKHEWVEGYDLSQDGFNFLATNEDLFHGYMDKGFFVRLLDAAMDLNFFKALNGNGAFKKIQDHHKSSIYANLRLDALREGETVSDDVEKYYKKYVEDGDKKSMGRLMVYFNNSLDEAEVLEHAYSELYRCDEFLPSLGK